MKSWIMKFYHWWLAHDLISDREYYTHKMQRHVTDNAGWWIFGISMAGAIVLFLLTYSVLWFVIGGLVIAIVVWLLLHLGKFA